MKIDKKSLCEKLALKVVQIGTDKTNFKILQMLPSNINTIMKETGLTKVPVNVRVNQLEKVGLVKRWRGTGMIVGTDFRNIFMETIDKGKDIIKGKLLDILGKVVY